MGGIEHPKDATVRPSLSSLEAQSKWEKEFGGLFFLEHTLKA